MRKIYKTETLLKSKIDQHEFELLPEAWQQIEKVLEEMDFFVSELLKDSNLLERERIDSKYL
jgi:hypothetical protein